MKKIILANNLAVVADHAFAVNSADRGILFAWFGALAYTFQIYFDFSGYSDMAIGLGKMFGFHFPQNFNYPYIAESITDFWRRWHISLSSWFRDYVYIPLGGSRGGPRRHIRNLLIVWLMTGIWHGANWTFILWGLTYFILLVAEKYIIHPERFSKHMKIVYRLAVFLAVMLCWVIFRSDSVRAAGQYLKSMLGMYGNPLVETEWFFYSREYLVLMILAFMFSTPVVGILNQKMKVGLNPILYEVLYGTIYIFLFSVCISYLVMGAHNPFIYFNF